MSFIKNPALSKLLALFLFLFLLTPTNLFAQQIAPKSDNPLSIEINNIAYSNDKRLVTLNFSVTNNSDSFFDNLDYAFEFYNGEKLAERGELFRDLQYVVATTGDFDRLAPKKTIKKTIKYEMPETVPGGSYFIRAGVYNEEISVYGVTYTKEPIRITGLGGFVLNKVAELVDVDSGKAYKALEGPVLEMDGNYVLRYSKDKNKSLFNALADGEIYADIKINHLSDQSKIVYEKSGVPLSTIMNSDKSAIEFKIQDWENKSSGSHNMEVYFKDANGDQISESTFARLLYKGLFGRIYKAETRINSYRKGEPVSLRTEVSVAGDESAKKAFLKAVFKYEGEVVQEFQKEFELNGQFSGTSATLTLMDQKMDSKTKVDTVDVSLVAEDGKVLDSQTVTIDTEEVFAYPKESSWIKNTLIGLGILILLLAIWAVVKKKVNMTVVSIMIAAVMIGGSLLIPNINTANAQYGDSNDICYDYLATNYYQQGPCQYDQNPYCQDATANNFGSYGACTYDPPIGGGCTQPSASNYDSTATYDDGSCIYETYGCMDFTASNYNPAATVDNGTCNYGQTGCTDSRANNFNPAATVDDGSCTFNRGCTDPWATNYDPSAIEDDGSCGYGYQPADGELMQITFTGSEPAEPEICTVEVPTEYYVNLQCKVCGNSSLDIDIKYWNKGVNISSSYNDEFTVNTDQVGNGHVFNNFVFGPYAVDYVLENKNPDGSINKNLYSNGIYTQNFAVQSATQFGSQFCQVNSNGEEFYEGYFTETETKEVACELPAELRASLFIDRNSDGTKDEDEPFLKTESNTCAGQNSSLLGLVRNQDGTTFSGLSPYKCSNGTTPYLFKDLLPDGNYQTALDPDNSFGFIQTGVKYLINSAWTEMEYVSLSATDTISSLIGVKLDSEYSVALSCAPNVSETTTFPAYVTWTPTIEFSDEYELDQVEFVWDGVNTNDPDENDEPISGGTDSGKLTMWHKEIKPRTENEALDYYELSVYAQDPNTKLRVSNTATCRINVNQIKVSCAPYSQDDFDNRLLYVNPGEEVYWKANIKNGGDNVTYVWDGPGVEGDENQTVGPVTYEEIGPKLIDITAYGVGGTRSDNSCQLSVKQCGLGLPLCDEGYYCNGEFMCVLNPPDFIQLLTLDPAVMNIQEGEQCRLKWIVDDADTCTLYKNGTEYPVTSATSTEGTPGLGVDPGTYTMTCSNSYSDTEGETVVQEVYGGPVRCLVNPNIREQ